MGCLQQYRCKTATSISKMVVGRPQSGCRSFKLCNLYTYQTHKILTASHNEMQDILNKTWRRLFLILLLHKQNIQGIVGH